MRSLNKVVKLLKFHSHFQSASSTIATPMEGISEGALFVEGIYVFKWRVSMVLYGVYPQVSWRVSTVLCGVYPQVS